MSSPRVREPFSLSDQVKQYIKVYAPRPELRRMDTSVGNLVLKMLHGKDNFNADIIQEWNDVSDENLFDNVWPEAATLQNGTTGVQTKETNMALPTDFRKEISVILIGLDGSKAAECVPIIDLNIYDSIAVMQLAPDFTSEAYYFQEFSFSENKRSNPNWVGNTLHIRSPVPFGSVQFRYFGYGKRYDRDSYNNVTSISWIDFQYPELVALEIASHELKSAGYQQEAANLEALKNDALHAFLTDQAGQMRGASHG